MILRNRIGVAPLCQYRAVDGVAGDWHHVHLVSRAVGVQLAHAGRKASTSPPAQGSGPLRPADGGWQVVGASPLPFAEGHPVPHELTAPELAEEVADFRAAADLVLLGRASLRDPHWPRHAARALGADDRLAPPTPSLRGWR